KLERERNKEYRSTSTQARAPEEPKVDKEKVRMLLESLWACVEPQQQQSPNMSASSTKRGSFFPENRLHSYPCESNVFQSPSHRIHESQCYPVQTKTTCTQLNSPPYVQKDIKYQASLQHTNGKRQVDKESKTKRLSQKHKKETLSTDLDSIDVSIEEILDLFKPLPPCISPLPVLNRDVNSLKIEDTEKKTHSDPTGNSVQQEDSLNTTSPSSNYLKSSILMTEESVDLPVTTEEPVNLPKSSILMAEEPMDTTQDMAHVSNGNNSSNFVQHDLCSITKTGNEETHPQEDMQTDQWPAAVQLAASLALSSASNIIVLYDVALLTTENQAPSSSINPRSSSANSVSEAPLCNTQNPGQVSLEHSQEEAREGQSDCVAKVDVIADPGGVTGTEVIIPDDREPLTRSNTAVSEAVFDVQPVTSSVSSSNLGCFVQHNQATNIENGAEIEDSNQESSGLGLGNQDGTVCKDHNGCLSKDTKVPEDNSDLSKVAESSINTVSNKTPEETVENDVSVKCFGEANADEPQTGRAEIAASTSQSDGAITPGNASPRMSPLLKVADPEDFLVDQRSGNKNNETSSTKAVSTETCNSEMIAEHNGPSHSDSQDIIHTVDSEHMQKSTHSLCMQLRSSCLLPTMKWQSLKPHAHPERGNIGVNRKCLSANQDPQPVPDIMEEGVVEKAIVNDIPQERTKSVKKEESKSCVVIHTTSLVQSTTVTNEQNQDVDLCEEVPNKLTSLTSPVADSSPETTAQPQEYIGHVRFEMGPPLPPVLTPLSSTPPKKVKPINPRQAIGKLIFPSPMDRLASPTTPVNSQLTSNSHQLNSSSLNSPVPPSGVPSSPLQFGSATPKHAVPVPGRLPFTAMNSSPASSSSSSQENSMRILDTMYPELSARARTLSILRGNVNLSICSSESGTSPATTDNQMSGFKTINSTSTAFTKTELRGEKRPASSLPQTKNNKCSRLETASPCVIRKPVPSSSSTSADKAISPQALRLEQLKNEKAPQTMEDGKPAKETLIFHTLEKIENRCFDLFPVIQSHLHVGNLPKKPVLRDEEKQVISESCQNSLLIADDMISAILKKLKAEKGLLSGNHMQALCRVYVGICRQTRDWEKAHILAYTILTEDFPDSAKLILFIVATWPTVLSHSSSLCQAIHAVTKLKAQEDVISCLSAYLGWEKSPPCDIDDLISRTLSEIRSGSSLSFIKHSHYGDDLGTEAWEHVFTLHLLCTHKKWKWTYENLLGKELWPLMNTWVTQPRDQQAPVSDVTVATVLRLIGRLGYVGIKERNVASVATVANVINTFGRHGQTEGVPWEVQLAAVYCIYDLSPCNPKQALDALAEWKAETTQSSPPAVTSCINQLAFIYRQDKS
ncbi:hypothetical protein LDENG_00100030, partial [Lucifuga dentata]